MKNKEEIEQLANEYAKSLSIKINKTEFTNYAILDFSNGYTQCQEDVGDKKYTEEDMINIVNKSRETGLTAEYLILQLNKQD